MTLFSAFQNIYSGCCTHCALDISAVGIYDPLPTASIEDTHKAVAHHARLSV